MTTQDLGTDDEGRPDLMSSPCTELHKAGDFPLVPSLMGNLVPMNYNMWMGNSKDGSSSGLHHDFHDNIYVLLRGTKRFRLFSPKDAYRMYTAGKIAKVHPNGRICYEGQLTNADGADLTAIEAMNADLAYASAEAEVAAAEMAVENGECGANERLAEAEEALEEAMEAALSAEMDEEAPDKLKGATQVKPSP